MPTSRTPLIFPELPRKQPVVRRGGRGSARNPCPGRRRGSTPIAAGSRASDDRCRRPRYHPPAIAGVRRGGAASPTRHLSPRLLPLSVPTPTRGALSHKSARVRALAASESERDSQRALHATTGCVVVSPWPSPSECTHEDVAPAASRVTQTTARTRRGTGESGECGVITWHERRFRTCISSCDVPPPRKARRHFPTDRPGLLRILCDERAEGNTLA